MQLVRDSGKIYDVISATQRTQVTFAGGFFRPFTDTKTAENGLRVSADGPEILLQFPRDSKCVETAPDARKAGCDCDGRTMAIRGRWDWGTALTHLETSKVNLVRVFAMNGVEFRQRNADPVDVYPFNGTPGAWLVKDAVVNGRFNRAYFDEYLRPFVAAADAKGIAVQLCLFSFHDFTNVNDPFFKYFPVVPWNAAATQPVDWRSNLIAGGNAVQRNIAFTNRNHPVTAVQDWWIGCVVQTLRGFGNVIYELFNEPRSIYKDAATNEVRNHRADLADWYDWAIGRIFHHNGSARRPLISVNAVFDNEFTRVWDVDVWKGRTGNRFADVDLISYHGLTGYEAARYAPCGGGSGDYAPVAPGDIVRRIGEHQGKYVQPLIFSTDAVRNPTHLYDDIERPAIKNPDGTIREPAGVLELEKRDGQLRTTTTPLTNEQEQRTFSDLYDWAFWSLREAFMPANSGRVHFQNHSIYRASFDQIAMARVATEGRGATVAPAYTTADWTQYRSLSDPNAGRNFWWAQRNLTAEGGSVTQLGTADAPADPRWAMTVETGWRCNFVPAGSGWCCFLVSYTPVSVSVRSSGASVSPLVVARLHEVAAGGALRPALATVDALVAPGAGPGTLALCANVVAGRTYALVMAGAVTVDYRNRYAGYGEVIVHFPSIRKVVP